MNITPPSSTKNDSAQKLTQSLRAISDPVRRRILQALKENKTGAASNEAIGKQSTTRPQAGKPFGLCASDIEERIKLSQPTISHHMAILTRAGLVEGKKSGQWVWYRRNEAGLRGLVHSLRKNL
jgi:DNA-binding transcriptional ArsR family regulator